MSYILDALRRADAERGRGEVPHLHTQAAPAGGPDAEDESPARPWLWLAAGLAIGLLAALAWVLNAGPSPAEAPAASTAAPPMPATANAASAPLPAADSREPSSSARPPAASSADAVAATAPSIVPRALSTSPAPVVARPEAARPAAPLAAASASAIPSSRPATASAPATTPATAAAPDSPIRALSDLPEDVRRELPTVAIGGSMYSENAASRMLIVNGQLLREGDKVAPAVTLEQIRLRSAVLRYKSWRYEIAF